MPLTLYFVKISDSMLAKTFGFIQKFFFYILIGGILIFLIFKAEEVKNIFVLFSKGGPYWIFLAIVCQIFTYIFNAFVYKDILKIYNKDDLITTRELMESSIVMLFLSKMIPSLGISNNWFFVNFLRQKDIHVKQGIQIVVLEIFTYYASLILLLLLGFIYLMTNHEMTKFIFRASIIGTILMIVTMVFVGWLFGHKKQLHYTINWFKKHFGKIFSSRNSIINDKNLEESNMNIESAVDVVKEKIHELFWPTVWQTMMFILNAYTIYFLFKAFNFDVHFGIVLVGFIMAQVLSLISLVPSGIGVFEGGIIFFYTNLDIPLEAAVVIILLFRGLSLFAPIPVGSYLYKKLTDRRQRIKTW